jgi:solute:Na+ symporter, SSS family
LSTTYSFKFLDILVILIYLACVLLIGFWASFKKKESKDLFLAGRNLSWPTIGLSIFGTNVSPSMMVSASAIAYTTGMAAVNFDWLAWIFLFILAMVFIPHYLNTKITTMPEFLERRFNKKCRNFLSIYVLFTTLILWLGGALYSGGILLNQLTGWPLWSCFTLLMIISASFTVTGGLLAVALTDNFNSILMILGSFVLFLIAYIKIGGASNILHIVPPDHWNLLRPASDTSLPWHAIILGYPILGIWFWCTDQTIVQRVLGAKDIKQGQYGSIFMGFLKLVSALIFFIPGIIAVGLFPNIKNPDTVYMTMVTSLLPAGMIGFIIAILLAALVSTVDGALNSFSTVFTFDVYKAFINPKVDDKKLRYFGQVFTMLAGVVGILIAMFMASLGKDMFNLLQGIIAFFAPPMSTVFLIGVLWKRATSKAALFTLIFGSILSLTIGYCQITNFPNAYFWPHYMLLSFYLFVFLCAVMVVISFFTKDEHPAKALPTLKETYKTGESYKTVWILWAILAVIMVALYIIFDIVL